MFFDKGRGAPVIFPTLLFIKFQISDLRRSTMKRCILVLFLLTSLILSSCETLRKASPQPPVQTSAVEVAAAASSTPLFSAPPRNDVTWRNSRSDFLWSARAIFRSLWQR